MALARRLLFCCGMISREEIEGRSKRFGVAALGTIRSLAHRPDAWDATRQLSRAATSVGANHRAMRRARSYKEFSSKLQTVTEEIDEACYWLEILLALPDITNPELAALYREACELRAIFAKARATTRSRLDATTHPPHSTRPGPDLEP